MRTVQDDGLPEFTVSALPSLSLSFALRINIAVFAYGFFLPVGYGN